MTEQRGMTVIEVLIAMAILAIVSAAIVSAMPTVSAVNRAAVDSLDVTVVAKSYFEVVAKEWDTRTAFDAAVLPAASSTAARTCSATTMNPDGTLSPPIRRRVELRCVATGAAPQVFWIELGRPLP
jgi:prepilin-type N-terminal cleavage/methylation domain-containing protein